MKVASSLSVMFLCRSCASGMLIHVLGLQELQIPPRCNTYLVIRKRIITLIL